MKERTEVVSGRFTPRERKVIKAQAVKDGLTESEYVRSSVMMALLLDGNVEAAQIAADIIKGKLKRWVEDRAKAGELVTA